MGNVALAQPDPLTAEDRPETWTSGNFEFTSTPSCGASGCTFTIEAKKDGVVFFHFINMSADVSALSDNCIRIGTTHDFIGIYDVANVSSPILPQVICREEDTRRLYNDEVVGYRYVDRTAKMLGKQLKERMARLEIRAAQWSRLDEQTQHATIVEALAITQIFLREGLEPPRPKNIKKFVQKLIPRVFDKVVDGVVDAVNDRLNKRGLGGGLSILLN
ncbi:MAG: hypothetical protein A2294_02340 [Candidatus Magasanikbacteria bacterium RIFOXYB2_FULL_38_10]|nr:MAG: hypothetical protein A2294_02340 [Candidatus Magasanikbacteria bacterium RIFOXYB2_FULL_38_10]